jgi:hypothetical protein
MAEVLEGFDIHHLARFPSDDTLYRSFRAGNTGNAVLIQGLVGMAGATFKAHDVI